MLACSCLTGIIIILYSDFVYTIKFKYPLTFGMFLIAFVISWLLSDKKDCEKNVKHIVMIVLLICIFIISLI